MADILTQIDEYIAGQPEWKQRNLALLRQAVKEVEPGIEEAWKWSVPVFLVKGKLVCAMSVFKDHTKFNFFEGAALKDDAGLFNNGFDSEKHRSIDLFETDIIDAKSLKQLLAEAVANAK